ncbi:MAG: flagellar basal body L-ring protein FlgH [Deltaproteobacteria bacterium]|nr:flagellar basal body L-ring protein FlgH [Deltaproteobacteria bacterium]
MKTRQGWTRPAALCAGIVLVVTAACAPRHIKRYTPRERSYRVPAAAPAPREEAAPGSLLQEAGSGGILFADPRAFRVNDVLIVRIEEVADAQRQSGVEFKRDSQSSHVVKSLPFFNRLGREVNPPIALDPETRLEGEGKDAYGTQGATGRSERLLATVPVVVRRVLPNGNLFVEGHRVILVNEEEHHYYVSGVVRPIDIDQQNSIRSNQVADAEIEFVGRGVVTDNEEQGWLGRVFGFIRPF